MNRFEMKFEELMEQKRKALIPYIMTCDPDFATAQKIMDALPGVGADIIELGMAFSDPTADGPNIQDAAIRGINGGATLKKTLELVQNFRKKNQVTPVVLMGYLNPILKYGMLEFIKDSRKAGVDGFIIVDMSLEEEGPVATEMKANNICLIKLVAPTTGEARLKEILKTASGFVYYISMAGVTGAKSVNPATVAPGVATIKANTTLPVAVGFGIKTSEQAREISRYADAVVVGSSLVSIIGQHGRSPRLMDEVKGYVSSLSKALHY